MHRSSQGRLRVWMTGPFRLYNQALAALTATLPGIACVGTSLISEAILPEATDLLEIVDYRAL